MPFAALGDVPQADAQVGAGRGERLAVGGEGERADEVLVGRPAAQLGAAAVGQHDGAALRPRDVPAVGSDGDVIAGARQRTEVLAARDIEQADGADGTLHRHRLAAIEQRDRPAGIGIVLQALGITPIPAPDAGRVGDEQRVAARSERQREPAGADASLERPAG